jgi:hypothetical protein
LILQGVTSETLTLFFVFLQKSVFNSGDTFGDIPGDTYRDNHGDIYGDNIKE